MKYTVRKLELHNAIKVTPGTVSPDGTRSIHEYRSLVAKNELEPPTLSHLADGKDVPEIPAGTYLFAQGPDAASESSFRNGAEALWLESLWKGVEFKNDRIYARILSEDSKTVYQLFREIRAEASRP